MKYLLLLAALFCVLCANAQNYLISFAGTGLSSVKVENLTSGVSVNLTAGETLNLSPATGISKDEKQKNAGLKLFPNPMTEESVLEFIPPAAGDVIISVFEITGKPVTQIKSFAENSPQRFRISGIKRGLYIISVKGKDFLFSGKLVSGGNATGKISVEKTGSNIPQVSGKIIEDNSKGVQTNTDLPYSTGDVLKYTGTSGNNTTIVTDIPVANKTITFIFSACTDGSGNNYPVVVIGSQTWMAANLKTTKFASGGNIPLVNTVTNWYNNVYATTKAYCWYDDNIVNKDTYGGLYTWAAAMNGAASSSATPSGVQGVCPTGWHLPSHAEWTTLTTYLGGETVAGGKMKEPGTSLWVTPNTGADNISGFSALPGGNRTMYGPFENIGIKGGWWSSSEQATNYAYRRLIFNNSTDVNSTTANYKSYAYSVRCIKN